MAQLQSHLVFNDWLLNHADCAAYLSAIDPPTSLPVDALGQWCAESRARIVASLDAFSETVAHRITQTQSEIAACSHFKRPSNSAFYDSDEKRRLSRIHKWLIIFSYEYRPRMFNEQLALLNSRYQDLRELKALFRGNIIPPDMALSVAASFYNTTPAKTVNSAKLTHQHDSRGRNHRIYTARLDFPVRGIHRPRN
jgi:hypothetical protein